MTAPAAYEGYQQWKGWGGEDFLQQRPEVSLWLTAELADAPVSGAPFLDIGFGNGEVLAWAKARGATQIFGTEIDAQAEAIARERGVTVLDNEFAKWPTALDGSFGTIVAMDVLEHLDHDQIGSLLDNAARLLRPGGWFVARFPNGQSPFGRVYQHGDATHVSILSGPIVGQLAAGKPFTLRKAGDPVRAREGLSVREAGRWVRDLARRAVESGIRRMFRFDVPFDPNLIVILVRD